MIIDDFIKYVKDIDKRLKVLEQNAVIKTLKFPTDGKLIIPVSASAPASPTTGQIYYDSVLGKFRGYNGSGWVDLN